MTKAQELNLIWKHTHPDFKGKIDGKRHVLCWIDGSGTCSVPLDALPEKEYQSKLGYAQRREARGERGYR